MNKKELEKASIRAWQTRLYEELEKPRLRKLNKQARKARKQARYRRELVESLNAGASVNKPFVPKIIRKPASSDCTGKSKQAIEKSKQA